MSGRSEAEALAKASQKFGVPQDKIVLSQGGANEGEGRLRVCTYLVTPLPYGLPFKYYSYMYVCLLQLP